MEFPNLTSFSTVKDSALKQDIYPTVLLFKDLDKGELMIEWT